MPTRNDLKPFFDEAIIQFEQYLSKNWTRLMEDRLSALRVKANNALFASYKSFFTKGYSSPLFTFNGAPATPSNNVGVNINSLINKAVEIFGGLIKNQE